MEDTKKHRVGESNLDRHRKTPRGTNSRNQRKERNRNPRKRNLGFRKVKPLVYKKDLLLGHK
jgi:hypothetical protein